MSSEKLDFKKNVMMMAEEREESSEGYHGAPVKLLFTFLSSILALILSRWEPLVFLAAVSIVWAAGKVRLSLLIKAYIILAIALIICFLGAMYLPAIGGPRPITASSSKIRFTLLPALRMMVSLNMTLALVCSVPAGALSRLVSALPLPDFLFIPLIIVFRFIGTFVEEVSLVREALVAKTGRNLAYLAFLRPWKLWRGFFIPMVFRALAGADELSLALEMKGLRRKALFWERPKLLTKKDILILLVGLSIAGLCLYWQFGLTGNTRPPMGGRPG
jgi:energy-coupling factor transport system permease protein